MGQSGFIENVFRKIYADDVNRLRSMENLWKIRKMPSPLEWEKLHTKRATSLKKGKSEFDRDQKVWNVKESVQVFEERYVQICWDGWEKILMPLSPV